MSSLVSRAVSANQLMEGFADGLVNDAQLASISMSCQPWPVRKKAHLGAPQSCTLNFIADKSSHLSPLRLFLRHRHLPRRASSTLISAQEQWVRVRMWHGAPRYPPPGLQHRKRRYSADARGTRTRADGIAPCARTTYMDNSD